MGSPSQGQDVPHIPVDVFNNEGVTVNLRLPDFGLSNAERGAAAACVRLHFANRAVVQLKRGVLTCTIRRDRGKRGRQDLTLTELQREVPRLLREGVQKLRKKKANTQHRKTKKTTATTPVRRHGRRPRRQRRTNTSKTS